MGAPTREELERILDATNHYQVRVPRFVASPDRQRTLNRTLEAIEVLCRAARTLAAEEPKQINVDVAERITTAVYTALVGVDPDRVPAMSLVDAIERAAQEVVDGHFVLADATSRAYHQFQADERTAPAFETLQGAVSAWIAVERWQIQRPRRGRAPDRWGPVVAALAGAGILRGVEPGTVERQWKQWKSTQRDLGAVLRRHGASTTG